MNRLACILALLSGVAILPATTLAMEPYLPGSPRAFSKADADSDGKITAQELAPRVERRFARLDVDKNGQVSSAEIDAMLDAALERRRVRIMDRLDADKNGQISRAELEAAIERLILAADDDKDGAVSTEEVRRHRLAKRAKPATEESSN
jgi:Ca2+-binding EF-hand superfamily protein